MLHVDTHHTPVHPLPTFHLVVFILKFVFIHQIIRFGRSTRIHGSHQPPRLAQARTTPRDQENQA